MPQAIPTNLQRATLALVVSGLLCATAIPVLAQQTDYQPLLDRIDRLERDVNLLQRQVYRGGTTSAGTPMPMSPPDASSTLSGEVRIGQLEDQMRALTGQLEDMHHGLDELKRRLDTLSSDIDQRFAGLPQASAAGGAAAAGGGRSAAAPPPSAAAPPPPGGTPGTANGSGVLGMIPAGSDAAATPAQKPQQQAALPGGTPQEQYNYAFGLLRRADYPAAEQALKSFVQKYPNDGLAGNAQYWLGETYFVRKNYEDAATAFALGYQKYPKGGKAPDNLLKLGMSLGSLGKKQEACAAFARLDRDFPTASSAIKDRETSERKAVGCS